MAELTYPVRLAVDYPDRTLNRTTTAFRLVAAVPINLELQRFTNRVWAYLALMDDRYPSTTDRQSVRLDYDYPDVPHGISTAGSRW